MLLAADRRPLTRPGRVRVALVAAGAAAAALGGCDAPDPPVPAIASGPFHDVFDVVARTVLEEPAQDPMGDLGILVELSAGGFVLSDALRPRLRLYDQEGRLRAETGRYGAGPFEFRSIGGLAETGVGGIVVTDTRLGRVTLFGPDLAPDTIFAFRRGLRGYVSRIGDDFVFATAVRSRESGLTYYSGADWTAGWTVAMPSPGSMAEYPYWGSVATTPVAVVGDELAVAYSLRYPILIRDRRGQLVDSLETPPPSFRPASVPEIGAFAGPGSAGRMAAWLDSFDVIARLDVVADTLLVVTHGRLHDTPGRAAVTIHERLDIYDLPGRRKIAEDVRLPPSSRVVGGGSALFVLATQPPRSWTVLSARPRP